MKTLGIDIGSTTSKAVILDRGDRILSSVVVPSGIGTQGPQKAIDEVIGLSGLDEKDISASVVTGYGRNNFQKADARISELTCHALGGSFILPGVRTVIDIGGQDAKVLVLDENGRMQNFIMNDKCAAGTGRFLEVMARILQIEIDDMADLCLLAEVPAAISNTCTVFAESEVISQLARGIPMTDLVAGICESVALRVAAQAKRAGVREKVYMSGGVARNGGVRTALERALGVSIIHSPYAQVSGALGAALYAYKENL